MNTTLNNLACGESAVIVSCEDNSQNIVSRLEDLGLCGGEEIKCVMKSPLGGCRAYLIKGSVIALRACAAKCVRVEGDGENGAGAFSEKAPAPQKGS